MPGTVLVEDGAFEELDDRCCFGGWLCGCCKDCNSVAGLFLFLLLIVFRLCASIIALGIALLQRLDVICISAILIYTLYLKKNHLQIIRNCLLDIFGKKKVDL